VFTKIGARFRAGFVRPEESYPNFYYRYSYDIAHVLGLRIFGIYAKDGRVHVRWWLVLVNAAAIFGPIGAGVVANHCDGASLQQASTSIGWIAYFSFLATVVQIFSLGGVHVFHGLTPSLEQCLTKKGMKNYERWASISTALFPQLGWAITWSALGCGALFLITLEPAIATALHVTWASYLSIAISVFYLSGGVWWIFAGSILSYKLTGQGCLRLLPYAPAMTPGIELLIRCYRLTFVGACVGVVLCLTPILTWTSVQPTSPIAVATALALVVLSFFALVVVAILPDWMLSKAILRERHQSLIAINQLLPQRPRNLGAVGEQEEYLLVWMQTLAGAPRGTINESVIVTIIAALLSSTLPLFISKLINF
jgi:membrane protein